MIEKVKILNTGLWLKEIFYSKHDLRDLEVLLLLLLLLLKEVLGQNFLFLFWLCYPK